jgi:predicted nucleotide-binding protein
MKERILRFIERAEKLKCQSADTPEFDAWLDDVTRFLKKNYGNDSHEATTFGEILFYDFVTAITEGKYVGEQIYQNGLEQAILYLKNYQSDFENEGDDLNKANNTNNKDIFLVHGRNEGIKSEVSNLLTRLELNPIILNEQANKGKTIIEKFEIHADVKAAIALFTADDTGKYKTDKDFETRVRQNVVFETGYFIGKLGREKTIILLEEGLKIPSDLDGYIYISLDTKKRWQFDLAKELKSIGFDIDLNKM